MADSINYDALDPGWYVEATYSTKDGRALLVAMKDICRRRSAAREDAAESVVAP